MDSSQPELTGKGGKKKKKKNNSPKKKQAVF